MSNFPPYPFRPGADRKVVDDAWSRDPNADEMVVCDDLASQRWLGAALECLSVTPHYSPTQGLTMLTVKQGRGAGWIVDAGAWGIPAAECVRLLPGLFEALGVGCWPTASALGWATMRAHYSAGSPLIGAPADIDATFAESMTGGRAEIVSRETFRLAYEWDMNMAYAAAARLLPGGRPVLDYDWAPGRKAGVQYVHAHWSAPPGLLLGALHVRTEEGALDWRAPCGEGWYWSWELERAKAAGYTLVCDYSIWFPETMSGLDDWATWIWNRRQQAGASLSPLIKLAAVAGIGRFGMHAEKLRIVSQEDHPEAAPMTTPDGYSDDLGIIGEPALPSGLSYIASYIHARVRAWLYDMALRFAREGRLIATNFDAVIVLPDVNGGAEVAGLDLPTFPRLGGWKVKPLHNVQTIKNRWLTSDEKWTTPGVPR